MVYTKTIIHVYSDSTAFGFEEFMRGTLFLSNYVVTRSTANNPISIKVNITNTDILPSIIVHNMDTGSINPLVYYYEIYNKENDDLVRKLDDFMKGSLPTLVVSTNAYIARSQVNNMAYLQFLQLIGFTQQKYSEAAAVVANSLLNTGTLSQLQNGNGYGVIYIYGNTDYTWDYAKIQSIGKQIWEALDFTKPIIVLSNSYQLKIILSGYLTNTGYNHEPSRIINFNLQIDNNDFIINYLILMKSKNIYSYGDTPFIEFDMNLYKINETNDAIIGRLIVDTVPLYYKTDTRSITLPNILVSTFSIINGIVIDPNGIIYVADTNNNRICKILSDNKITPFYSFTETVKPYGLIMDSTGNLYVSGYQSNLLYKITPAGVKSVFTTQGDTFLKPAGLAFDLNGNIIVADSENNRVCNVDTLGNITVLSTGFSLPQGVAVDSTNTVYVTDTFNHQICSIDNGNIIIIAGGGGSGYIDSSGGGSQFYQPNAITIDSYDNIYVADTFNHVIRKIDTNNIVTTVAGSHIKGNLDGLAYAAKFGYLNGITFDTSGSLYVTDVLDTSGNTFSGIRKLNSTNTAVSTVVGRQIGDTSLVSLPEFLNAPSGISTDLNNNLYFTDTNNHKIYKYGNDGVITLIGGSTQGYLDASGASQAKFNQPTDIVFGPEGYLYVVDSGNNAIRIIRPDGNIYTFINTGLLNPRGITIDESNTLYLTDTGNNRVCNITIGGILTTMVGYSDYTSGFSDGQGNLASFNGPTGIVIDKQSNLYVVDTGNNAIRRITPAGIVTTVAENVYEYNRPNLYSAENLDTIVEAPEPSNLNRPMGITIDLKGYLYITDTGNNRIKKISPKGLQYSIVGTVDSGLIDGYGVFNEIGVNTSPEKLAKFNGPTGIVINHDNIIHVTDTNNSLIRRITSVQSLPTKVFTFPMQEIPARG